MTVAEADEKGEKKPRNSEPRVFNLGLLMFLPMPVKVTDVLLVSEFQLRMRAAISTDRDFGW